MAKFIRSINVEEDVWNEAKTTFPNLSQFIENFLKAALLSKNNNELQLKQTQIRLQQEIMAKETELVAVEAQLTNIADTQKVDTQTQNNIWRIVMNEYRDEGSLIDRDINEATKKLSIDEDMLMKTVENVVFDLKHQDANIMDVRNWAFVEKHYVKRT